MRTHEIKNILDLTCLLSILLYGYAMFDRGFLIMKKIYLGGKHGSVIGNYALVSNKDYPIINNYNWYASVGCNTIYAACNNPEIKVNIASMSMHRFVLNVIDSKIKIDHKDGNGLNNQRNNLRIATSSQNRANSRLSKNNTHGFIGIKRNNTGLGWSANVRHNKKTNWVGSFVSKEDAAYHRDLVAIKLFGDFAVLNFPNNIHEYLEIINNKLFNVCQFKKTTTSMIEYFAEFDKLDIGSELILSTQNESDRYHQAIYKYLKVTKKGWRVFRKDDNGIFKISIK